MEKITDIIISGSIARDEIMSFPHLFADYIAKDRLKDLNVSFVVSGLVKELGGTGTNIAYNARLVTKKPVHILGAVGKDGEDFVTFFKTHKIDTKGLLRDKTLFTAKGAVITDKNQNQLWSFYYGALEKTKPLQKKDAQGKNSVLIISATHKTPFLNIQKQAKKLKLPYVYDPGMSLTWIENSALEEGVKGAEWLIGNEYEMAQIEKRLKTKIFRLLAEGKKVITTLGEHGVRYEEKGLAHEVPAFRVKKVIDPTGAGDAWRGGFWGSLAEGFTLKDALRMANALASFVVESYGTVNHKPSMKEIISRAKNL